MAAVTLPASADPVAATPRVEPAVVAPTALATDVYLTPFKAINESADWAFAGRAVQQNLLADLTRALYRSTAAATDADPLPAARAAGARYLVTGTYQSVESQLRLNGQVVDVATGDAVGALTVTGDGRDLFGLEDQLSAQVVRALNRATHHLARTPATRPVPPDLQPAALAAMTNPPAAGVGSAYAGSALESYVNGNRTPSVDYNQQLANARQQNTFSSYNNYGGPDGQGYAGFPGGGFGYGAYGYGSYGYGSYGYGGGGYLLGVSYPIAVNSYSYGGIGYGGGYRGGFAGGRSGVGGLGARGFGGGRAGLR